MNGTRWISGKKYQDLFVVVYRKLIAHAMLHGIITRHVNVHVFERVVHIILGVRYRFQIVLIFALSPARDSRSPFPAFHDYECYVYSSSALLSVNLGLAAILETG